jgi:hypothetical protein
MNLERDFSVITRRNLRLADEAIQFSWIAAFVQYHAILAMTRMIWSLREDFCA